MNVINKNAVTEIFQKNDTSEQVAEYIKTRERNARGGENSISSIRQQMMLKGFSPAPQELLSTLRELDKAGIIELRGDKFRWRYGIKDLAKTLESDPMPKAATTQAPSQASTKTVVVYLQNGRKFEASFPASMNDEELKNITDILARQGK